MRITAVWTNTEIREHALRWLEEVDWIRKKSVNINGALSGRMRCRVSILKSMVNTLTERAEDQGSAVYNRARSEELERQLRSMERTVDGLKEELKESEERNRSLRARIKDFEDRLGSMSMSFEGEEEEKKKEKEKVKLDKDKRGLSSAEHGVPRRGQKETLVEHVAILRLYDEKIKEQVNLLNEVCVARRSVNDRVGGARDAGDSAERGSGAGLPRRLPRVIGNVRLAPPPPPPGRDSGSTSEVTPVGGNTVGSFVRGMDRAQK